MRKIELKTASNHVNLIVRRLSALRRMNEILSMNEKAMIVSFSCETMKCDRALLHASIYASHSLFSLSVKRYKNSQENYTQRDGRVCR